MAEREIAVDLDGTLAYYDHWRGPEHIGEPIKPMVDRVKSWLADGQKVVIFTARACNPNDTIVVKNWIRDNGLGDLEVTCIKRKEFVEFWDDRAFHVIKNTGQALAHPKHKLKEPATLQPIGKIEVFDESLRTHYADMPIQPFHFIRRNGIKAAEAEIITHVIRHERKAGKEDLIKAKMLIEMLIKEDYE